MIRFAKALCMTAFLALAAWGSAFAIPTTLQYQGRLTDNAGAPLNGSFNVTFTIYADSLGTLSRWTETRSVTVANGLFSITLGTGTPIGPAVFTTTEPNRFLGIRVAPDVADMLPRQRISPVGFAHHAANVDAMPGISNDEQAGASVAPGATAVVASVTITTPAAGYIFVTAGGDGYIFHVNGTTSDCNYRLSDVALDAGFGAGAKQYYIDGGAATGLYISGIHCQRVFARAAGTYTFYLNLNVSSGAGGNDGVQAAYATAIFLPALYGTATGPQEGPASTSAPAGPHVGASPDERP